MQAAGRRLRREVPPASGCGQVRRASPELLRAGLLGAVALLAGPAAGQTLPPSLDSAFSTTELERMCTVPAHRLNVQLMWDNRELADLDLHAMRPDGTHISYRARGTNRCQGVLDHDRLRDSRFATPETFFVQQEGCRAAPQGDYRIWVRYFGGRLPVVPFTLTIRLGDSVQVTCRGTVSQARARRQSGFLRLPANAEALESGEVSLPDWCG